MKLKVGIIGFGRMGRFYLKEFMNNAHYEVAYICDLDENCRTLAQKDAPHAHVTDRMDDIFEDPEVQVVALCAFANSRMPQIERAIASGKHIISEKPISDKIEKEWKLVDMVEHYDHFSTVNMYLLNSWYHNTMRDYIRTGAIGDLAILRICHMTPGLAPGEGHSSEGPCFHDCGMHYVNLARWYAGSEFKTWHSQGIRMWSYKDPWWVQCHGTFENGVVFDITQGFVYGQLSKDQTHNSYVDIIGTKGICRMTHDFKTAHVEMRGVNDTQIIDKPFGGKNIDVLIAEMADSIEQGRRNPKMPTFRESATASEYAWKFLKDAYEHDLPAIGTQEELDAIHERRRNLKNGYGLLPRLNKNV